MARSTFGSRYQPSGDVLDAIRAGDRVRIVDRFGKEREGRAVMRGPGGWVLNMGGRHGTPAIATAANITKVRKGARSNPPSGPLWELYAHPAAHLLGGARGRKWAQDHQKEHGAGLWLKADGGAVLYYTGRDARRHQTSWKAVTSANARAVLDALNNALRARAAGNPVQHEGNGGGHQDAIGARIAQLRREGYDAPQASAIAYREARDGKLGAAAKRAADATSFRKNPPRRVLFSRRVLRLDYEHALNGDGRDVARVHRFGPGVQMYALDDGSVLLKHRDARKQVWADLPDRGR